MKWIPAGDRLAFHLKRNQFTETSKSRTKLENIYSRRQACTDRSTGDEVIIVTKNEMSTNHHKRQMRERSFRRQHNWSNCSSHRTVLIYKPLIFQCKSLVFDLMNFGCDGDFVAMRWRYFAHFKNRFIRFFVQSRSFHAIHSESIFNLEAWIEFHF